MPAALVCGAGGFIGAHLARRLKSEGYQVTGADLHYPEYADSAADDFVVGDLRDSGLCHDLIGRGFDEIYQLAADMGGAGYLFTGENDAAVMHNSAMINLNLLNAMALSGSGRIFYSSSACVYPRANQVDPQHPVCREDSAYPADPDSEYGWEKLFSERLYLSFARNCGIEVRIARFHNIFGEEGHYDGGREKSPAALCRKVAAAPDGGAIEIWGDGRQTRSYLYIEECLDGVRRLMQSGFTGPVNLGSEEMVSINQLADLIMDIAGKELHKHHVTGPEGVRGRCSDNRLIREQLGWAPSRPLREGLVTTYQWIERQVTGSGQS